MITAARRPDLVAELAAVLAPNLSADCAAPVAGVIARRLLAPSADVRQELRPYVLDLEAAVLAVEAAIGPQAPRGEPGDVSCTDLSLATAGAIHGPCSPGGRS